jgi:hypothetical protein
VNGRLLGVLGWLVVSAWSATALAWGDIGHRIICEIAFRELSETARERVKALIRQDPRVRHVCRGLQLARPSTPPG